VIGMGGRSDKGWENGMRESVAETLDKTYFNDDPDMVRKWLKDLRRAHDNIHEAIKAVKSNLADEVLRSDFEEANQSRTAYDMLNKAHFAMEWLELNVVDHLRRIAGTDADDESPDAGDFAQALKGLMEHLMENMGPSKLVDLAQKTKDFMEGDQDVECRICHKPVKAGSTAVAVDTDDGAIVHADCAVSTGEAMPWEVPDV
jgi:hypothetical protein